MSKNPLTLFSGDPKGSAIVHHGASNPTVRRPERNVASSGIAVFALTLLLLVFPYIAAAEELPPSPSPLHWESFTTRDNLPHDSVRTIAIAGETIWVGTDAGLAASDGKSWRCWRRFDSDPQSPAPVVSSISPDATTGEVWLGTLGQGLYRYSGGRFDRFDQLNSGLAGNIVFTTVHHNGCIWAATNGGVSSFDPRTATWRLCGERAHDRPDQVVVRFVPDGENLYAVTEHNDIAVITRDNCDSPGPLHDVPGPIGAVEQAVSRRVAAIAALGNARFEGRLRDVAVQHGEWWVATSNGLVHGCRAAGSLWGTAIRRDPGETNPPTPPASVRLGVLASTNPLMALPGATAPPRRPLDVPAVLLAIEEANARGGWNSQIPYELVHDPHGYARYGWTLPEDDLATLAFASDVCGIVAWIEPADRSMAALAARAEVPIANASPHAPAAPHHWLFTVQDPAADDAFAARYAARYRRPAPPEAVRSYRAALALIAAVESAGPDRAPIAQRLQTVTADPPDRSATP